MTLFRIVLISFLGVLVFSFTDWTAGFSLKEVERQYHGTTPWGHAIAANKRGTSRSQTAWVTNLRYHRHLTHTRLVFDLQAPIQYTKAPTSSKHDVEFEFTPSRLSKKAREKLIGKQFPEAVHVSELPNHVIRVSVDLTKLRTYKITTLTSPHRLVLDLYHLHDGQDRASPLPPIRQEPATPVRSVKDLLIVIDPGHGGKDPGAIGQKGTKEKFITLAIGKILRELIQSRLKTQVFLTRKDDQFLSLKKRVQIANAKKADLFVSIHANSHTQKSIRGLELYYFGKASDPRALEVAARENGTPLNQNAPAWQFILADKLNDQKIDESRDLAWTTREVLVKTLTKHYTIKDHGVKTAPFYVLRFTTMPSILAEVAFISNPTEEKRLRNVAFQRRMAEGIFAGIQTYLSSATL